MDQPLDVTTSALHALTSQFGDTLRGKTVLAAVSGGVDSVVLVHVLRELQSSLGYELAAVTVDHNMRTDGSSQQDAAFTESFCRQLSVPCTVSVIPPGILAQTAEERNGGVEDAARFLRYELFASAAADCHAAIVCLAHNRNDQLETLLERFLQGADAAGSRGIPQYRAPYFRPLLSVSRDEIENYARSHNLTWRTDPTNNDTSYLRNRIRHNLMPLLTREFAGWDTAALKGAEKAAVESEALEALAASCSWKNLTTSIIFTDSSAFLAQPLAVRIRILYNGLRCLGSKKRVPYGTICAFAEQLQTVTVSDVTFSVKDDSVVLAMNDMVPVALSGFSCVISGAGEYDIPLGTIQVTVDDSGFGTAQCMATGAVSGKFRLPAVIRSACSSDGIRTKDNSMKSVVKVLSEWKVPAGRKNEIPVIEDTEVRGIWGEPAGFDNWFVLQGVDCE